MKKRNFFKSILLVTLPTLILSVFSSALNASELSVPLDSVSNESEISATVPSGVTNGYNLAFANPKTYDGTPYIEITDMIFADVLATDDVSATGIGTLSSSNAGTYSVVNIDSIVLKGADKDKYDGLLPTSMTDVPINLTVEKAIPEFSFSCADPDGIKFQDSTTVTFSITNDFGYPEGLPDLIYMVKSNPFVSGATWETPMQRSGNQYSAIYNSADSLPNISYGFLPVWAFVPSDAQNYQSVTSAEYFVFVLEPLADYYWSGDQEVFHSLVSQGEYYTEESFQPFLDIWNSIDWHLTASQQHIVDNYYLQLLEAYKKLVPLPGDYSSIEELLSHIPSDLSLYTTESVNALKEAKNAIKWDLPLLEQDTIDSYASDLEYAIQNLAYKPEFQPANYTAVEKALAKIPSDLTLYTEESVKVLEETKASIQWELTASDQAIVDGYAEAIEQAIADLQFRPADYTKLQEALAQIPEDLSLYTEETIQALEDAKSAIQWDLTVKEQALVNGYVEAIEKAITALQFRPADYTKVQQALAKVPTDLSGYTEESVRALETVKANIDWNLKINEQATVNGYANAIEQAIQSLQKKQTQAPSPKASNPANPNQTGKLSAKTGDSTNIVLWLSLLIGSLSVVSKWFVRKKLS